MTGLYSGLTSCHSKHFIIITYVVLLVISGNCHHMIWMVYLIVLAKALYWVITSQTMAMLANFVTKLTMTVGVFLTTLGTSDDESYNMKLEKVQHTLRWWAGCVVECQTANRGDGSSILPAAVTKLRQFCSPHICLYLSEETLKAGGPFYLASMPA